MKTIQEVCDEITTRFNDITQPAIRFGELKWIYRTLAITYELPESEVVAEFHAAQDRFEKSRGIPNTKDEAKKIANLLADIGMGG